MKNRKFSPVIVYKLMLYEFANKSSSTTATGIADAYAFCFSPKVVIKVGTVEPFLAISFFMLSGKNTDSQTNQTIHKALPLQQVFPYSPSRNSSRKDMSVVCLWEKTLKKLPAHSQFRNKSYISSHSRGKKNKENALKAISLQKSQFFYKKKTPRHT